MDKAKYLYISSYHNSRMMEKTNNIVNEIYEGKMTDKTLKEIIKAKKEIREGKGQRIEDVAKELGIKI